ncbi:repeat protein [Moumouvirus goulette]|uniref:Repeat protein n=1 Tax=Moumouvirus goulette TaxID=1247379 RepID=M1PBX6_9VIRU|nr:repeat protein [Moumouvirus goulette]AGF85424.1 repeat protein [Moumouvirus goulette]
MSRYQPRIIINYPEKYVPDDIIEQFFLTLKSGNIDNIRNFVAQNKNKYNILERGGRGSSAISGKTPSHAVLELDDKIANNRKKLEIIEYLYQMGSPIDLPDNNNIWPIHLAANLQSEKIIDFLLSKKVSPNRKDSSNNTPLQYAIYGKQIPCPKSSSIGPIVPSQPVEGPPINNTLAHMNRYIMNQLNSNFTLNDNVIHLINTINNIPQMYTGQNFERRLQSEIVQIFSDLITDPENTITQQTRLEQLINNTYANINEELLTGLISPLNIRPNNSGWGPIISSETLARPPNNIERILETDRITLRNNIDNEYNRIRNTITDINIIASNNNITKIIPEILTNTDLTIDALIFSQTGTTKFIRNTDDLPIDDLPANSILYGERLSLIKTLFLLIWNNYRINYGQFFADKVLNNFPLMSQNQFRIVSRRGFIPQSNREDTLYGSTLSHIFRTGILTNTSIYDNALDEIINYYDQDINFLNTGYNSCIGVRLMNLFTNRNADQFKINLKDTILNRPLTEIFKLSEYQNLIPEFSTLRTQFQDRNRNWFELLTQLIKDISPVNRIYDPNNDIFSTIIPAGYNFILPNTPLPNPNRIGVNTNIYTLLEAFRVIEILLNYLTTRRVVVDIYPNIFGENISNWNNYIDTLTNLNIRGGQTLTQSYPEVIFLYRILVIYSQEQIRKYVATCVNTIINRLNNDTSDDDIVVNNKQLFGPLDDAYLMNILLPSEPERDAFNIIADEDTIDPYLDLKQNKWDSGNPLIRRFARFQYDIIPSNFSQLINGLIVDPNIFTHAGLNNLRQIIETNIVNNNEVINTIITNPEFRNGVRSYWGARISSSVVNIIPSHNIIQRFNIITRNILLEQVFDRNFTKLRNGIIDSNTFLTETYGYFFVIVKQRILKLEQSLVTINNITADIVSNINNRTIYYIPQIFLPALIKQVLIIIIGLISIRDYLSQFNNRINDFTGYIDTSNSESGRIITTGNRFIELIIRQLPVIYTNILDIIKYHNNVIDFLNYHSAYQLIRSRRDFENVSGQNAARNFFDMNLVPMENIPNTFEEIKSLDEFLTIFRIYSIPEIRYYAQQQERNVLRYDIYGVNDKIDEDGYYNFDNYRNVINYNRSGVVSNSPFDGDNLQLNTIAYDQGNDTPIFDIMEIMNPIKGTWLNFLPDNPTQITYHDAFIAYIIDYYRYQWLNGMPASIRNFLPMYTKMIKQRIIEEVVQYFVNDTSTDAQKIRDEIQRINSGNNLAEISNVASYTAVAKQTDNILNNILEYSLRQTITNWIYQYTRTDARLSSLINNGLINIIQNEYFQKLSLNQINTTNINNFLANNPEEIEIKLPQIELNPDNIKYTTGTIQKRFINYLQNIDYASKSNSNSTCYYVNPNIVKKLITGENINSKNSDGNTPLHIAVSMTEPEIVELLTQRGANKTFTNIYNKNPKDISIENLLEHVKYTDGKLVIDTINNFVVPFNDLLLSRLKEDRFKNNIVKNITLAIPINLIMFNHLFHLYLENYRYDFNIELKNSIKLLFKKYFNLDSVIYPIDLFNVSNVAKLLNALENQSPTTRAINTINKSNQVKINTYNKQIDLLKNQIDNLIKEKRTTSDPEQILFIDNVLTSLQQQVKNIQSKIATFVTSPITHDNSVISNYQSIVQSINNRTINRNLSLIDFYDMSFKRIGNNNQLYLTIWDDYLNRDVLSTPSMIFSLLNKIINLNINKILNGKYDNDTNTELNIIGNFYEITKNYIESKNQYPDNLDDNPILQEEAKQTIYLINLILTPTIRNILLNQIFTGLSEMDPLNTFTSNPSQIIDNILNVQYNGLTLDQYLSNVLPILTYKYYSRRYNNSNDVDKNITNDNDLYLPIIQIIQQNTLIGLNDDSIVIQNTREYIIPFISNTYQNFIYHVGLSQYAYERYLLNTYKLIKILQLLV